MKRWTVRILLYLLLGVVTTVGVAWVCVLMMPLTWQLSDGNYSIRREGDTVTSQCTGFGFRWVDVMCVSKEPDMSIRGPIDVRVLAVDAWVREWPVSLRDQSFVVRTVVGGEWEIGTECGWPLRVFRGVMRTAKNDQGYTQVGVLQIGHRHFPLRPILPGFLINTLLYASLWFGIVFGVGATRRTIRRRRARCVKCGYDLRGQGSEVSGQKSESSHRCPECGWRCERADL